jgi:hypothetical protein
VKRKHIFLIITDQQRYHTIAVLSAGHKARPSTLLHHRAELTQPPIP